MQITQDKWRHKKSVKKLRMSLSVGPEILVTEEIDVPVMGPYYDKKQWSDTVAREKEAFLRKHVQVSVEEIL